MGVAEPPLLVPLTHINALMAVVGSAQRHAVAEQLLRMLGACVPLAQCTIFSFEQPNRPRIVAMGDRSRTGALPRIAQAYVTRFFRLDPALALLTDSTQADRCGADAHIVLHRQCPQDIAHPEYRQVCYELPRVAERLALLVRYEGRFWMSVNFYRGVEHGRFDDEAVAVIRAFAPTIVHAVRLHHTGSALQQDLAGLMQARALRRHPGLTRRDQDVLASLLKGQSAEDMADNLGLTVASAQTYVKRLYRKLGLAGQRELLAWLMEPTERV